MHQPTFVSYLTPANTNSTYSSFTHPLFHTCITSLIHPQLSEGSSCASVVSKREKKKKKQPPVCFLWWLQLSSLFQTFKKVLWISSRSPASSRARPCTPLCSSPGLSVGEATHNQHEAVTSSFNREMVKNVELTNPPACTVKYMLLLNGYTLMLRWEHKPSVTYSRRAQNARIQYGVHTSLCIVSEQHAKHMFYQKKQTYEVEIKGNEIVVELREEWGVKMLCNRSRKSDDSPSHEPYTLEGGVKEIDKFTKKRRWRADGGRMIKDKIVKKKKKRTMNILNKLFYNDRHSGLLPQSPHQTGRPPGGEGRRPRAVAGPEDLPGGTWSDTAWPTRPPLG